MVRFLSKLMGMIEPKEAGKMLATHIHFVPKSDLAGRFYVKGKLRKTKSIITDGTKLLEELIKFSNDFTEINIGTNKRKSAQ